MSSPYYASAAARLLRRAALPTRPNAAADERALSTIQLALSAGQRARRLARGGATMALAAAGFAAIFGWRVWSSSVMVPARSGSQVEVSVLEESGASVVDAARHRAALRAGTAIALGSRIETTTGGGAALLLSTGTALALAGESKLTLRAGGALQQFVLDSGGLQASVAKLGPGARFVVATPDAEVEVRGTRFRLNVLNEPETCAASRTRLTVQEGRVEVRWRGQTVLVTAGQLWPEACGAKGPPEVAPETPAKLGTNVGARPQPSLRPSRRGMPAASVSSAPLAVATPAPRRSELAEQTQLFADASRLAQSGNVSAALARYEELVSTYPTSALAENAIVERMRLLRGAAAKREAERYRWRYPRGFGKSEAERILAAP